MYRLPYQTVESVAATIKRALEIEPDRVALFSDAHVPWMKRHQKLLPEYVLSGQLDRAGAEPGAAMLMEAGYQPIGLNHFARPDYLMVRRQGKKRLHRNFQGYTTDEAVTLIAFGDFSHRRAAARLYPERGKHGRLPRCDRVGPARYRPQPGADGQRSVAARNH
jgi:coproporphyrinogen III oxidase-like Fe-S oxidoreductase